MKYFTRRNLTSQVLGVEVEDIEIDSFETNELLRRFHISILNRLATMIAGYYFKKNKDKIDEFLKGENLDAAIQRAIIEKIKDRITLT